MEKKFNVICIKWGDAYPSEYVINPYSMIKRNTSYEIDFYCFTENSKSLNENIIIKPVETNTKAIINEAQKLLDDETEYNTMSKTHNPYGDGLACEKIIDYIRKAA